METQNSTKIFTQTIEVFQKFMLDKNLTSNVSEFNGRFSKEFKISEKQFNWLLNTYIKEGGVTAPKVGITITNDEGQFSFSPSDKRFNVPHYIPNRENYGIYYLITFWSNK